MSFNSSRRKFVRNSLLLSALPLADMDWSAPAADPLLSFSTLGCPDWTFEETVAFAVKHGYRGLEMRGVQREMHLPKAMPFSTPAAIAASKALMRTHKLAFVNLGSSSTLHFREGAEREKQLNDGRAFIDLAQQLGCPYVRVYPNNFPKDQEKEETLQLIASGLRSLGTYAADKGVKVLMETHGDLLWTKDLHQLMTMTDHVNVGLVWDVANMWMVTGEAPGDMYTQLKPYIHHAHIKDASKVDGKWQYCFLGKGTVPIADTVRILRANDYKGYYSFEWEKLWHPELAAPELALADYPLAMKRLRV